MVLGYVLCVHNRIKKKLRGKENEHQSGKSGRDYMRSLKMILLLALLLGSTPAYAMTYKNFKGLKNIAIEGTIEAVTLTVYLAVVAKTYRDMNLRLKKKGKTPLYCQPETLSLNQDTVTDIIETKAEKTQQKGAEVDTASVSTILLEGLRETFPCT
jgi:hypothetical protein